MKKRVLACLLSLCLCVGMVSAAGINVRAEDGVNTATESGDTADNQQGLDGDSSENPNQQDTDGKVGNGDGSGSNGNGTTENGTTDNGIPDVDGTQGQADTGNPSGNGTDDLEGANAEKPDSENQDANEVVTPVEIPCMDEDGNIYYITDDVSPVVESGGLRARAGGDQVVNLRVKKNGTVVDDTTKYIEYGTGEAGYYFGGIAADAAYLGMENGKVKFMLSGVVGLVDPSMVQVVYKNNIASVSSYYANGANLVHSICTNMNTSPTSSLNVGPQPSYMSTGATYYSYDGHYFYTDYSRMLADYRNNTRANSINPGTPYYNYYQYLPLRSTTTYSGAQLSSIINARINSSSKMWNIGNSLVTNQNTYGVNALLAAGLAANESGWGTSSIAQAKNNLFGLGAIDSSPGESANSFASPDACVKNFAEGWMSKRYLNPNNGNYFGGFLGNKASGINVKYASDPYWGEKAAAIAWSFDTAGTDRNRYSIGIKDTLSTGHTDLNVRKESSAASTKLFSTGTQSSHAFILLEEENGFYKVQSDPVLNSARTGINNSSGNYNFSSMYGYVSKDYVDVVSGGVESNTELSVSYSSHVQTYGWLGTVKNGASSGTEGEAKRMEAIKVQLKNAPYSGSIQYRAYAQTYGWLDWVADNAEAGTSGQAKRLEAMQIKLTGEMANRYDVYYRVHAQTFGWMGWAKNGESAGSADYAKRLEAVQIVLVEKGGAAPGSTSDAFRQRLIKYRTHVQSYGWQGYVYDGAESGTTGKAKRLEGIQISLAAKAFSGSVKYKTHVQTYGWQDWVNEGAVSGTTGKAKRLEAIQIELTGEMAKQYDIYYRVHSQTFGWLGWAKNGEKAGTAGYAKRLESIQIVLVSKGGTAPGSTERCYLEK